jgi:FkbM family methyltransferase
MKHRIKRGLALLKRAISGGAGSENAGTTEHCPFKVQADLLQRAGIDEVVIFDIGANDGATAKRYRSLFSKARIYSFEPFPASFAKLQEAMKDDELFVATNAAVTEEGGKRILYVNHFDPTNSLLPRPSQGKRYYLSQATPKTSVIVDAVYLDSFTQTLPEFDACILKMDIQGGELSALKGAASLLKSGRIAIVYVEVMFVPLYEGAAMFDELSLYLREFNYKLYDLFDLHRAKDGQLRYCDAIFISETLRAMALDAHEDEP